MCTLVAATRVWAGAPLVIAANRDERLDRPAEPPALRDDGPLRVLAPRDAQAGGTWLGLNAEGVFVGITNRFDRPPDPNRRSRGHLVLRALEAPTPAEAADRIAGIEPRAFNGFHLLAAGVRDAHLVWSDGAAIRRRALGPGVHVLTERSFGAAPSDREDFVKRRTQALLSGPLPEVSTFETLLRHHASASFEGTCVHMDERGYGTRSSSILLLSEERRASRMLHADGPPCVTPYVEVAALREL